MAKREQNNWKERKWKKILKKEENNEVGRTN